MTTSCNWSCCGAIENLRLYAGGKRCPQHTPAALKGVPEPEELLAKVDANRQAPTADMCSLCGQPMNHIYRDDGAHPWCAESKDTVMPDTIAVPADAFNAILAVFQRRGTLAWLATAPDDSPMKPLLLEFAAAHSAGSTQLTPETAYKVAHRAAAIYGDEPYDLDAECAYFAVRDLIPADRLAELDGQQ